MTITTTSKPTALYRLYGAEDALLYIGISEDPEKRWAHHASEKAWWPQVTRKSVEWYDSRELAEAAEATAIATERTPHNVAGSPWAPKPRELGAGEMLVSEAAANLTLVANTVRLQDRIIRLVRPNRERTPRAAIVPVDIADLIEAAGGLDAARDALRDKAGKKQ